MGKSNFIWSKLSKKDYNRLLSFISNNNTIDNDFIGCVEKGSLKFDFVYREINNNEFKLCVDFYGLSDDDSYDTTEDGVSYDYYDGFDIDINTIKNLHSYKHFKEYCNNAITKNVIGNELLNKQFNSPFNNWK